MKPILFNTGMVRAILEGEKTVTRQVMKPQPEGRPVPIPDQLMQMDGGPHEVQK